MKRFMVLDTEATNTGKESAARFGVGASVYDLGYVVADATGAVYYQNRTIIADTFNDAALMRSAYYADKLPQYYTELANGCKLMTVKEALHALRSDIRTYGVKDVWAYNARFDADALNSTVAQASNGFCEWALPYGVKWRDIMRFAQSTVCDTKKYRAWCEAHGLITKTGRARVTAEAVYQYLTGDDGYTEQHTALSDAQDELAILLACLKRKKKMPKRFN